jgi:hypothetical protein
VIIILGDDDHTLVRVEQPFELRNRTSGEAVVDGAI